MIKFYLNLVIAISCVCRATNRMMIRVAIVFLRLNA